MRLKTIKLGRGVIMLNVLIGIIAGWVILYLIVVISFISRR